MDLLNQSLIEKCPVKKGVEIVIELGIALADFHLFRSLQYLKIWMLTKRLLSNILLINQLIFIDSALKMFKLDGKRLLIMRVVALVIKNKNMLKI